MENLNSFVKQLKNLQQDALHLLDGINGEQWGWTVSAREWSIAQCMDHINTVNALVAPRLAKAVQHGLAEGIFAPGPFRYPLFDRLFVFALEPRAPLKQRAPAIYQPASLPGLAESRQRFLEMQERLIADARSSAGLDLVRIKIASPVSVRLRFSLGTWLAAIAAHEDNHLRQAKRVAEDPRFPR